MGAISNHTLSWVLEIIGRRWMVEPEFGQLTFVLPNGKSVHMTGSLPGPQAVLTLNNFKVISKSVRAGAVGFGKAFIDGDIEADDLVALFRFFIQNEESFARSKHGFFDRAVSDAAYHLSRANTRAGSKMNISEHYDLGNDFYAEWLDPSMTYSSGIFQDEQTSLSEAQQIKYAQVAEAAGIKKGETVLEIGCGWGGFAEYVSAKYHASLRGISLSKEQLKYAKKRLQDKGLSDNSKLVFEDYRDTEGTFDHVASIEMIEAVGEEHWPRYFSTINERLNPGGTAAIQAITIEGHRFEDYRSKVDFIQRYIFPGGMLLTNRIMAEQGQRAGLTLEGYQTFGQSYAKTLQLWRERFLARWDKIKAQGFDERFKRSWLYYLAYCEAGFTEGAIDVGIYTYRKSDELTG